MKNRLCICNDAAQWVKVIGPALVYLMCRWLLRLAGASEWSEAVGMGLLFAAFGVFFFCRSRPELISCRNAVRIVLLYGVPGFAAGGLIQLLPGGQETESCTLAATLLLCVLGPACEETVYRGLVFDSAEKLDGFAFALAVSTILFACGHRTPLQAAVSVPVGLILGVIRKKEGNLLAPMAFHAMLNAAALFFAAQAG